MEFFTPENGLWALFTLSFLASTVVPLGSEWLLVLMVASGTDPVAAVSVATAGNTAGAVTTYGIGLTGGKWLTRRVLRMDESSITRTKERYRKYGSWSLLLSWLPIVGDPLCLVGGILKVQWWRFLSLVTVGKLARYWAVAWIVIRAKN